MEWAAKSDVGLVRKSNEDSYIVRIQPNKQSVAIVADGMGGYQGGKVASDLTVTSIIESIDQFFPEDRDASYSEIDMTFVIKRAIKYANDKVYSLSQDHLELAGMGTTVVTAIVSQEEVVVGHAGDSRAYIISDDQIMQITTDHSLVNELVHQGKISEEEALIHPQRHMITRALGTSPNIEVDIGKYEWGANDILLLCTDGLSEVVSQEQLLHALHNEPSLDQAVTCLLNKSLEVGGKDNITIVAIKNSASANVHQEGGDWHGVE